MKRLEKDRPAISSDVEFSLKEVMRSLGSPHVIMLSIMVFMVGMMSYGLAVFLPSIVNQLGFSPNTTQLLSVGPFMTGFIGECFFKARLIKAYSLLISPVSLTSAFFSDRYAKRGVVIILVTILAVAGFALFLSDVAFFFNSYASLPDFRRY